jgi:hypothetical protein
VGFETVMATAFPPTKGMAGVPPSRFSRLPHHRSICGIREGSVTSPRCRGLTASTQEVTQEGSRPLGSGS